MNKLLKVVGGIFATVLLGGIGSGVWEKVLSPAISYISNKAILLMSTLSSSYSDTIYSSAATLEGDANLNAGHWLFILVGSTIFFAYVLRKNRDKPAIDSFCDNSNRMFSSSASVVAAAALLLSMAVAQSTDSEIYTIRSNSLENLEIIRPYVGNGKYLELRSEFLQIKSKKNFDEFIIAIKNAVEDKDVSLESYRR